MPVDLSGHTMKACVIHSVLAALTAELLILFQTWLVLSIQTCGTNAFSHSQESTVSDAQSSSTTSRPPQHHLGDEHLCSSSPPCSWVLLQPRTFRTHFKPQASSVPCHQLQAVPHTALFNPFKSPSTFCWKNAGRAEGTTRLQSTPRLQKPAKSLTFKKLYPNPPWFTRRMEVSRSDLSSFKNLKQKWGDTETDAVIENTPGLPNLALHPLGHFENAKICVPFFQTYPKWQQQPFRSEVCLLRAKAVLGKALPGSTAVPPCHHSSVIPALPSAGNPRVKPQLVKWHNKGL